MAIKVKIINQLEDNYSYVIFCDEEKKAVILDPAESKPILDFIGLKQATISVWAYWPIRIIIIFPVYQISLLIIGTLFGQSEFFKKFIKKMFRR